MLRSNLMIDIIGLCTDGTILWAAVCCYMMCVLSCEISYDYDIICFPYCYFTICNDAVREYAIYQSGLFGTNVSFCLVCDYRTEDQGSVSSSQGMLQS